jgi:DNA-directed RNA polymerase
VGTGKLDKRKARNGVAPNWVHSLDGDVVTMTVNDLDTHKIEFVNAVHDDIAVLAPDMECLQHSLLNKVADMFSENLLLRFSKDLQPMLPKGVYLPEHPPLGTLDVDLVRQSKYFFA